MFITKIKFERGVYHLFTDEGHDFTIEEDTLVKFGFYKGMEIERDLFSEIMREDEISKGKKLVLPFLKRRRTINEVMEYLRKRDISSEVSEEIIPWLEEFGFLDDSSYADAFIHDKIKLKKDGPRKIEFLAKEKGLSASLIEEKLAQIDKETWRESAHALLLKKFKKNTWKTLEEKYKMERYLMGKGYDLSTIKEVLLCE